MSVYVAQIAQGVVVQVTVEPEDYLPDAAEALIGPENTVGIGWRWDGVTFRPPEVAAEEGDAA